jgi:peptidyl-tRNA hydrolase, PTH1 family
LKLIAGLGNPGTKYATTRHNIGFLVVQQFAGNSGISLKKNGFQGVYGVGRAAGAETTLLLPQTFMNRSGVSVAAACRSLDVEPHDLIVVHDDIELPFGALRIRSGGGHGGHNGIRSIREVLGTGDFVRLKVGVGRPPAGGDVSGWVLAHFGAEERKGLDTILEACVAALETVLSAGVSQAMNEFNNRNVLQD